jgi:hypothetical protein
MNLSCDALPSSWFTSKRDAMNSKSFIVLVLGLLLLSACKKDADKGDKEDQKTGTKQSSAEKAPAYLVKHGTNGEVSLTIEKNTQQAIGLQVTALQPARLNAQAKAYGRVLDPSGLAALAGDLVTAQAAARASEAELKRSKTLAAQNNASERAVQTAEATAAHDQAQLQSVRLRLLSSWGNAIAQRNDLPEFVQALGSMTSALVQLEVPASEPLSGAPVAARLFTLNDETNAIEAQLLGPAPSVDPQMQGRGYLLMVNPNPGLVPGAALTGYLSLPGEPRAGVLVPRNAVFRFDSATWIYHQTSDDTFVRESIVLDTPLSDGWFVEGELKPGDKVVSVGAQQLLSEELKGQGGGEQ